MAVEWLGWVVACLLDRADGEFARLGDMRSDSGHRLDLYADTLLNAGWFVGAGLGPRDGPLGHTAPPLGLLVGGLMVFCSWVSEAVETESAPGAKIWRGSRRLHPDDALFLLAPFTWLGWLAPILVASSVCLPVIAVVCTLRYVRPRRAASGSVATRARSETAP